MKNKDHMLERILRVVLESYHVKNSIIDEIISKATGKEEKRIIDVFDFERPYTRKEVAQLIGKSVWTVDLYAKKGVLRRAYRTESNRSVGYSASSVREFLRNHQ